jgi:hypothetical protein
MKINLTPHRIFLALGMAMIALPASAQLHVTMAGDVGIGTTSPIAKLQVTNVNNSFTAWFDDFSSTNGYKYGIVNQVYSPKGGSTYGFYNYSSPAYGVNGPGTDFTVGQFNFTDGAQGTAQGIFNMTFQYDCAIGQSYGMFNQLYTDTKNEAYGLYNSVEAANSCGESPVYGIYNTVNPSAKGTNYGIYSQTPGAGNYAGFFDGNVHINGSLTVISDERKKQAITKLDGAMALVEKMNGYSYTFKEDANFNLPEGKQYGFLAQELAQVLPELVRDGQNPLHALPGAVQEKPKALKPGEKLTDVSRPDLGSEDFKSVNYLAVIPILVEAMKEQQVQLEAQRQEIDALRTELNKK